MNDLPRQKLRELIQERGPQLCDDHKTVPHPAPAVLPRAEDRG